MKCASKIKNEGGRVALNGKYEDVLTGEICDGDTEILPYSVRVFKLLKKQLK